MIPFLARAEGRLLALAIGGYCAATLGLWAALLLPASEGTERAAKWARRVLLAAVALHAASLAGQGGAVLTVRAGVVGVFGWVLALLVLLLGSARRFAGRRVRRAALQPAAASGAGFTAREEASSEAARFAGRGTSLSAFVVPLALVAASYSLLTSGLHSAAPRALGSEILVLHVVMIVGAYAALSWAFAASLVYLLEERMLKRKRGGGLWGKLPPLSVADGWIARATAFGAALLTLGLALGALWTAMPGASHAARAHAEIMPPLHDPKVVASLLTWLVFAGALAARRWLGWRGRRAHLVIVGGFVMLALSFLATPHWLNAR